MEVSMGGGGGVPGLKIWIFKIKGCWVEIWIIPSFFLVSFFSLFSLFLFFLLVGMGRRVAGRQRGTGKGGAIR
jgi:hypothetical protein